MEKSTNTNNTIEVGTRTHDVLYACVAKLFDFFLLRSLSKIAKCVVTRVADKCLA